VNPATSAASCLRGRPLKSRFNRRKFSTTCSPIAEPFSLFFVSLSHIVIAAAFDALAMVLQGQMPVLF
jgi:hypothetical protein